MFDSTLTPLLKHMKDESLSTQKLYRAKSNFINVCDCYKQVHAYCMTAKIVFDKRIACNKCGMYYKLFIKKEKVCSGKFLELMLKYCMIIILLMVVAALFLIQDAYLKYQFAKKEPEVIQEYLDKYNELNKGMYLS